MTASVVDPGDRRRGSPARVTTAAELRVGGVTRAQLSRELREGRWRRAGHAIVLHNGPWSGHQRRRIAQVHGGPTAVFTAFTAAELLGVSGWERAETHLLAPVGTRLRVGCPVPVRLHLAGTIGFRCATGQTIELLPDALVRAAGSFGSARPACGLLAAAVQQRRTTTVELIGALDRAVRVRHRRDLIAAVRDIAGGSEALSEIDFVRLCRRHGLPEPVRQAVRRDSAGRRRYLDACWHRADGRTVVVEIDGALHLSARRWWDDQLRQNEIALADALVLRYPTVVLRTETRLVVGQLRRALLLPP